MRTRAFACLLLLLTALPALGEEHLPAVAARPPVYTDAAPPGLDVNERLAEIARRVQEVSRYPEMARERGVAGTSEVSFEVGSAGVPEHIETSATSGHPVLDRAARRAVEDAAPLPFVYGRVTVPVEFSLREN